MGEGGNAVRYRRPLTILEAMADPAIFAPWFQGGSWAAWRVFLSALFGLPMNKVAMEIYQQSARRSNAPLSPAKEAWLVVGRRGGKSLLSALVAVFLACFRDYRKLLARGERGTVMVIAADRIQARVVLQYIKGFLDNVPTLRAMVKSKTNEGIELSNKIVIEIHTCSFRAVRGYTIVAAVCDEIAFWRAEESANPDAEILNGIRPGMATVPDSLLLCISSPYARRGALWESYKEHFGKDGDPVLFWQADTQSMNPTVSQKVIQDAYQADPESASAEYGAQFRSDVESFAGVEAVEGAVVPQRFELQPVSGVRYFGFVDPSGGSQDSMTLAVAHHENGKVVLDAVREKRPPFSPEAVSAEFAEALKRYRVGTVQGDRYAGEWPREQFRKHGVDYKPAEKTKSEIYLELLPALNSGKVELLDSKRLGSQLVGLERRTSRSGRDSIDHAPSTHDDVVNAAAGALVLALHKGSAPVRMPILVGERSCSLWELPGALPRWEDRERWRQEVNKRR